MTTKRSKRANPVPLIVEPHPADYDGYPFITLIQHRNEHILAIIDNASDKTIEAFVLDLCGPEKVNEEIIIAIAAEWYKEEGGRYPISVEFSKRGVTSETSKILRSYKVDFVTRVIGPLLSYPMNTVKSVKRRRRKPVPQGMEVHKKVIELKPV
jgi:hypothetical protein